MAPPGLRSPEDTPRPGPPGTAPGPGPAALAGTAGGEAGAGEGAPTPPEEGGPASMLRTAVQELRKSEMLLLEMAKQFPAAAKALRDASTGIRAALRQIITNPGTPEPPAPAIGG